MTKILYLFILLIPVSTTAQSPIPPNAKLEKLTTGFLQPEGPVWVDSIGLLFSDIQANTIYRWSPSDSSLTPYLYPSDSSNGLTLNLQRRLILTQMAKRRVARQDSNGTITPLTSTFRGKKYNSPNDVAVKSDGSIFFTDPDFNIPLGQSSELIFRGIYRISPSGTVTLLDSTFDKPNGICFSPDETKLYVNESPQDKIYVWNVVNDSTITGKRVFYTIPKTGYADGMKVDPDGNVYCTGPSGVWVISPTGVCLDTILIPETPSNCNWGDADRKTLYITAGHSLYRIRLAMATGMQNHGSLQLKKFELYPNYPNPFNPSTEIRYTLLKTEHVKLIIYDISGQKVKTLIDAVQSPGTYNFVWNAATNEGKQIASGTYLACLSIGKISKSIKLLLLK